MTLEYTNRAPEKKFEKDDLEIRMIAKTVVRIIRSEKRRDVANCELIKAAFSGSLEQHALGIQDAFGNLVTKFPYMEKLNKNILQVETAIQSARENFLTIKEAYDQFDSRAKDVLSTVRLNPSKLSLQKYDLGVFLENFVIEKQKDGAKINIKLDLAGLRHQKVLIDNKKMRECFEMILKNAEESKAKEIFLRAFSRYGETDNNKNKAVIVVTRDGEQLDTVKKKQAFMLFAAGGGLSAVRSIVEAHQGNIVLPEFRKKTHEEKPTNSPKEKSVNQDNEKPDPTIFVIHLPLA
jgi:hypothetical protein